MYEYSAKLVRVIDADTVVLDVDLGLETTRRLTVRLYGINAPERFTDMGKVATAFATNFLTDQDLIITTFKDKREKYGRYLATVMVGSKSLNNELVAQGLAKYVTY